MDDKTLENFVIQYNDIFEKYRKLNSKKLEKIFTERMIKWTRMNYNDPIRYSLNFLIMNIFEYGKTSWLQLKSVDKNENVMKLLKDNIPLVTKSKYKKGKKLGAGYFGEVEIVKIGKRELVQKKIPLPSNIYTARNIIKEIKYLKKLKGSKIVPNYYDSYMTNSEIYIVMEKLNCGTLNEYMKKNNIEKLPKKDIHEIKSLISKLHKKGFIHNDLHGNNILVECNKKGEKKRFVLSDLGLTEHITDIRDRDYSYLLPQIETMGEQEIQEKITKGQYSLNYQLKICTLWDLVIPTKGQKTYFRALHMHQS